MKIHKSIKVLGITTDFNKCDCCGKEDLKQTVTILDVESGIEAHYGTTCAAKADKYDTLEAVNQAKKEIAAAVNSFKKREQFAMNQVWKYLAKIHGTTSLGDGGSKLNCSTLVFQNEIKKFLSNQI